MRHSHESCISSSSVKGEEVRLTTHSADRFHTVSVLWKRSPEAAFAFKLLIMSGTSWRFSAVMPWSNFNFALVHSALPLTFITCPFCYFGSLTSWMMISAFGFSKCLHLPLTSSLSLNDALSQTFVLFAHLLIVCAEKQMGTNTHRRASFQEHCGWHSQMESRMEGCTVKELQRDFFFSSSHHKADCADWQCWISLCAAHIVSPLFLWRGYVGWL